VLRAGRPGAGGGPPGWGAGLGAGLVWAGRVLRFVGLPGLGKGSGWAGRGWAPGAGGRGGAGGLGKVARPGQGVGSGAVNGTFASVAAL